MILMNNVHMKSESLTQQELILYDRIRRDINSGFTLEEAVDNLVVLYQPLPDSQKISIEKVPLSQNLFAVKRHCQDKPGIWGSAVTLRRLVSDSA
jgi:hypothetical protein